jgi:hypothetical protein
MKFSSEIKGLFKAARLTGKRKRVDESATSSDYEDDEKVASS